MSIRPTSDQSRYALVPAKSLHEVLSMSALHNGPQNAIGMDLCMTRRKDLTTERLRSQLEDAEARIVGLEAANGELSTRVASLGRENRNLVVQVNALDRRDYDTLAELKEAIQRLRVGVDVRTPESTQLMIDNLQDSMTALSLSMNQLSSERADVMASQTLANNKDVVELLDASAGTIQSINNAIAGMEKTVLGINAIVEKLLASDGKLDVISKLVEGLRTELAGLRTQLDATKAAADRGVNMEAMEGLLKKVFAIPEDPGRRLVVLANAIMNEDVALVRAVITAHDQQMPFSIERGSPSPEGLEYYNAHVLSLLWRLYREPTPKTGAKKTLYKAKQIIDVFFDNGFKTMKPRMPHYPMWAIMHPLNETIRREPTIRSVGPDDSERLDILKIICYLYFEKKFVPMGVPEGWRNLTDLGYDGKSFSIPHPWDWGQWNHDKNAMFNDGIMGESLYSRSLNDIKLAVSKHPSWMRQYNDAMIDYLVLYSNVYQKVALEKYPPPMYQPAPPFELTPDRFRKDLKIVWQQATSTGR